jgi:hypothetical protein
MSVAATAEQPARSADRAVGPPWLRAQALNVSRHAAALRPFRKDEFGTGPEAPTEAHVNGVNRLIEALRAGLKPRTTAVRAAAEQAAKGPTSPNLQRLLRLKEQAHNWVRAVERVWDFYFELFGQRQSQPYGRWLLSCDRIALDCYQVCYMGIGVAKSVPAPPPFSYMRTGFSPATFRRGIPLTKLGKQLNPFPLVQLPYHRLVNPWTLGAVLHEVSHNLHSDLGLARAIPRAVALRLLRHGLPTPTAAVWARWNRELFADLSGVLLGGPNIVGSVLDIVARSPETTLAYSPTGVHPTPYLRGLLNMELLRRMGFAEEAARYRRLWQRMYPNPQAGTLPRHLLDTFADAGPLVVDTVCYQPFAELGGKKLSEVIPFGAKEQAMIEEAAGRLATGDDPGIIPERFLIGAARVALDRRQADPEAITAGFYKELSRR